MVTQVVKEGLVTCYHGHRPSKRSDSSRTFNSGYFLKCFHGEYMTAKLKTTLKDNL